MNWVDGDVYKYAFGSLSEVEERCASMCESLIIYDEDPEDSRYMGRFYEKLGSERVKEIYNTLKEFIDENCQIVRDTYRDGEGVSYNGIAWR